MQPGPLLLAWVGFFSVNQNCKQCSQTNTVHELASTLKADLFHHNWPLDSCLCEEREAGNTRWVVSSDWWLSLWGEEGIKLSPVAMVARTHKLQVVLQKVDSTQLKSTVCNVTVFVIYSCGVLTVRQQVNRTLCAQWAFSAVCAYHTSSLFTQVIWSCPFKVDFLLLNMQLHVSNYRSNGQVVV